MATSEGIPSSIDIEFLELNDNPYGRVGNSIVVNVLTAIFTAMIAQYPDYFQDVKELSPEELRAARKRESQRRYYEKHKEEIRRKSREYHKQQRANKKNQ